MTSPSKRLLAHLLSAHPFIPELHEDDCDDVSCVRCVKPPTSTSALDVPAAQLVADMAAHLERRRYANRPDPGRFECVHCGDRRGPLVPEPHGARYANQAQVLVCQNRCTPADEDRHSIDFDDTTFAAAAARFLAPATDADYPGWTPPHQEDQR